MTIKISEVQVNFIKPNNGIIAFASLVINNSIYLNSIAIHQKLNSSEHRITYPTKRLGIENSVNLFHPINKTTSLAIEKAIFSKLKDVMNKVNNHDRYGSNDIRKW